MRVMVAGAGGMLGRAVADEYTCRGAGVAALTREDLDITDIHRVRAAISAHKPEIVVNCAAYTNVDGAESEVRRAFLVNGLGPRNLAVACRETGTVLVQISTDYIFPGDRREAYGIYDRPCPVNVYGGSKLWGEEAVACNAGAYYIVRTSWLFGPGGSNFVATMLRLGRELDTIQVVHDQEGSPTFTADLAKAVADLSTSGCYGVFHVTNQGSTTWYNFAGKIFSLSSIGVKLVPCSTAAAGRPAPRPRYSVLDPFPLAETIGYLLPPWEDALARYTAAIL